MQLQDIPDVLVSPLDALPQFMQSQHHGLQFPAYARSTPAHQALDF